jgi:hypothetical protein
MNAIKYFVKKTAVLYGICQKHLVLIIDYKTRLNTTTKPTANSATAQTAVFFKLPFLIFS